MQGIINDLSEKTGINTEFFVHSNYALYHGGGVIVLIEDLGDDTGKVLVRKAGDDLANEQTTNLTDAVLIGVTATK